MKRKVLIDRVFAALERAIDHMKAIDDIADLGRRCAARRPGLQPRFSMPVRNSMTSSTSRIDDNDRNRRGRGRRAFSGTKAPTPVGLPPRPLCAQCGHASRTTVRLTPVAAISSCSVGRRAPGGMFPLVISAVSRVISSCASDRGGGSGRATDSFLAASILLDTSSASVII